MEIAAMMAAVGSYNLGPLTQSQPLWQCPLPTAHTTEQRAPVKQRWGMRWGVEQGSGGGKGKVSKGWESPTGERLKEVGRRGWEREVK